MSFGSRNDVPAPAPEPTAMESESVSTAQEARPLPYIAGERKIAVRWISRVYNQYTREAPQQRPGKK